MAKMAKLTMPVLAFLIFIGTPDVRMTRGSHEMGVILTPSGHMESVDGPPKVPTLAELKAAWDKAVSDKELPAAIATAKSNFEIAEEAEAVKMRFVSDGRPDGPTDQRDQIKGHFSAKLAETDGFVVKATSEGIAATAKGAEERVALKPIAGDRPGQHPKTALTPGSSPAARVAFTRPVQQNDVVTVIYTCYEEASVGAKTKCCDKLKNTLCAQTDKAGADAAQCKKFKRADCFATDSSTALDILRSADCKPELVKDKPNAQHKCAQKCGDNSACKDEVCCGIRGLQAPCAFCPFGQ